MSKMVCTNAHEVNTAAIGFPRQVPCIMKFNPEPIDEQKAKKHI